MDSSCTALVSEVAGMLCYGWTLQGRVPMAVLLVFLSLQSFCSASTFSGFNKLIMDLNRDRPGVGFAAIYLTRCWLGAVGTAFASLLVVSKGRTGWLSVVVAGIWLLFSPAVVVVLICGPRWREEKGRLAQESGR